MSGRRPFIRTADLPARVRDQFDDLHAKHGLDRRNDVYRASHIALYALYPLPSPPDVDWEPRRIIDADGLPDAGDLILNDEERTFVIACWVATAWRREAAQAGRSAA